MSTVFFEVVESRGGGLGAAIGGLKSEMGKLKGSRGSRVADSG
jgi:hypothetical protein